MIFLVSYFHFRHKDAKAQRNAKGSLRAPLRLCAFVAQKEKGENLYYI